MNTKEVKKYTPEDCDTDNVMFFEDGSNFRPYVKLDGKYTTFIHDKDVRVCIHDNRESSKSAFWHGALTGACFSITLILLAVRLFI